MHVHGKAEDLAPTVDGAGGCVGAWVFLGGGGRQWRGIASSADAAARRRALAPRRGARVLRKKRTPRQSFDPCHRVQLRVVLLLVLRRAAAAHTRGRDRARDDHFGVGVVRRCGWWGLGAGRGRDLEDARRVVVADKGARREEARAQADHSRGGSLVCTGFSFSDQSVVGAAQGEARAPAPLKGAHTLTLPPNPLGRNPTPSARNTAQQGYHCPPPAALLSSQ